MGKGIMGKERGGGCMTGSHRTVLIINAVIVVSSSWSLLLRIGKLSC